MNADQSPHPREVTGPAYTIEAMRKAQAQSWRALHAMAAAFSPGMCEREAIALGNEVLRDHGLTQAWHPLLIRFGADTLKVFSEPTDGSTVLGEDDIFFIDMGPVLDGHEGDAGATFVTGSDPEMAACAEAASTLFERVRTIWQHGEVGGIALYEAAAREAEAMGWLLNLDIKGHRVSDYPHRALPPGGQLGTFDAVPGAGLWILEIQIRHPTRPFGAFFEDLLA